MEVFPRHHDPGAGQASLWGLEGWEAPLVLLRGAPRGTIGTGRAPFLAPTVASEGAALTLPALGQNPATETLYNSDGTLQHAKLHALSRTWSHAVTGFPGHVHQRFDAATGRFNLTVSRPPPSHESSPSPPPTPASHPAPAVLPRSTSRARTFRRPLSSTSAPGTTPRA